MHAFKSCSADAMLFVRFEMQEPSAAVLRVTIVSAEASSRMDFGSLLVDDGEPLK
jgi:hypothetical protein